MCDVSVRGIHLWLAIHELCPIDVVQGLSLLALSANGSVGVLVLGYNILVVGWRTAVKARSAVSVGQRVRKAREASV